MSITQVGNDGTGWTAVGSFAGNGTAYYFKNGYSCAVKAAMKAAHVRVATVSTALLGRVYVYSGVGPGAPLVAMSSEIDLTQTGDRSAPIVGNLVPGLYTVVFQNSNSGLATQLVMNSGASLFTDNQNLPANFTYGAPPAVLPAADSISAGPEFAIWIETAANAVGQDGTGWIPANVFAGNGIAYYFKVGYQASAAANMKAAHVTVNQLGTETLCRVYVYAGIGPGSTLVAMSSEIDVTQLGDRSASIAGLLQPGQFYTLVVQNKSGALATQLTGNSGAGMFVNNQNTVATFPYGTPPSVLPAADFVGAGAEIEVWIEGGGGIALVNTVFTSAIVAPIRLTPGTAAVALATTSPNVIAQANPIPAPGQLSLVSAAVSLALGISPGPGIINVPGGGAPTLILGNAGAIKQPATSLIALVSQPPGITVTSTQGSGLTPNAGFTYTGMFAFEQPVTINVTDGRFGATGPIFVSFDDFRNGVLGQFMANGATPVAGIGVYAGGGSGAPIYRRTNRGGVNPAIAVLDNERAGGTGNGPFGRTGIKLQFGSHTQGFYSFYAETWRGTWDGRNDEGGGGGYYKMQWLLGDSADYGATSNDLVIPVFPEGAATSAGITSITWAAGVVTVVAAQAFGFAPGYGPTWRVTMGTGHGSSNGQIQQNPVALAGDFTATQINATTFTYPLAADPGPVITKGTFGEPGAVQGMNVPSNNIPTSIGGNTGIGNGVPGPALFPAGDSNGLSKWDTIGWNCQEAGWVADPVNPLTAPGRAYYALYNAVNKQAVSFPNTGSNFLSASQPAYNYWSQLQLVGLMQNLGTHTVDRADYFIQIGSNAYKRFMLGDASTLANCTTLMPCTPVSWSANSVTIVPRAGAFAIPDGAYLYWFDQNNAVQQVGRCAFNFDYYISATGSDNSAGTAASPWSFGSLCNADIPANVNAQRTANKALMAGKRIGVLPGQYNCTTLVPGGQFNNTAANQGFSTPIFTLPNGTAANPTVLQSVIPLAAVINGGGTDTNNPGANPLLGSRCVASEQYQVIDGFELTNHNSQLIATGGNSGNGVTPTAQGIVVKNNYVHLIRNNATNGGNTAGITIFGSIGPKVQNNYVTDLTNIQNRSTGIETWSSIQQIIEYNSIVLGQIAGAGNNPGGCIFIKGQQQHQATIRYNYCDNTGAGPNASSAIAWDVSGTLGNVSGCYGNILICGQGPFEVGIAGVTSTSQVEPCVWSNNTWVAGNGGSIKIWGSGPMMTFFNNVHSRAGAAGGRGDVNCQATAPALLDFNFWKSFAIGLTPAGSQANPASLLTTQAAIAAAIPPACVGKEAHSITGVVQFVGVPDSSGKVSTKYRLVPGSLGSAISANPGSSNGQISGTATDMGAWGGIDVNTGVAPAQIGSNLSTAP